MSLETAIASAEAACLKGWAVLDSVFTPRELGLPIISSDEVVAVAHRVGVDWRRFGPDVVIAWELNGDEAECFLRLAERLRARR
ncbi:MAG: hypothetical protein ACHQ01_08475 [Candidatus Limnocylindrales bacterium]